jgi:hypothetical protein
MDYKFEKRKNKKIKERRKKELNGKYSSKHIRNQTNISKKLKQKQKNNNNKKEIFE